MTADADEGGDPSALLPPDVLDSLRPVDGFTPEEWREHAAAVLPTFDQFNLGFLEIGGKPQRKSLESLARQHRASGQNGRHVAADRGIRAEHSPHASGETCAYVREMVAGLATDTHPSRHNGHLSQRVRLECARELGCISDGDYRAAVDLIDTRLRESRAVDGTGDSGEIHRAGLYAAEQVALKSISEMWAELGDHDHASRPDAPIVPRGTALPDSTPATQDDEPSNDDDRPLYADVGLFLAGELPDPPTPTVLARQDGWHLFYRGQVNNVFGDPESGKTFVTLAACAECLCAGGRVLFLDLDHNTMPAIVLRLIMLGVSREILADPDRFRYCEPMGAADLLRVAADCERWRPDVVVVDSLGELLPMLGASSDSADDFTVAHGQVLKPLAMCGAAVIVIDHLAKNPTSRVHGPGGTVAKRRVLGGVSLRVKVGRAFAPGKGGTAHLILNKDRHGGVRAHCPSGEREPMAGTFVLDPPDAAGVCAWRVMPPLEMCGTAPSLDERARQYLAALREAAPAAVSAATVAELVSGEAPATKAQVQQAHHWLTKLTEGGHAEIAREGGRGKGPTTWRFAEPRPAVVEQTAEQTALFRTGADT